MKPWQGKIQRLCNNQRCPKAMICTHCFRIKQIIYNQVCPPAWKTTAICFFCFFLPEQYSKPIAVIDSGNGVIEHRFIEQTAYSISFGWRKKRSYLFSLINPSLLEQLDVFFCAEEGQEWTVSTTTATVQCIMKKILQKYSNFSFYCLPLFTTRIKYSTLILICALVTL